ncbi:MAG: PIN domain-containing protein [Bacteroidota bacterium]
MPKLNLFIDTNIIIDLLADRIPFSNAAYQIFKKENLKRWNLYTSSNSILTAYYIVAKNSNLYNAKKAIKIIMNRLTIQDISKKGILNALNSKIDDLEDASQEECATNIGKIDYIITRDKKGFKHSKFKVISSDELIVLDQNN